MYEMHCTYLFCTHNTLFILVDCFFFLLFLSFFRLFVVKNVLAYSFLFTVQFFTLSVYLVYKLINSYLTFGITSEIRRISTKINKWPQHTKKTTMKRKESTRQYTNWCTQFVHNAYAHLTWGPFHITYNVKLPRAKFMRSLCCI